MDYEHIMDNGAGRTTATMHVNLHEICPDWRPVRLPVLWHQDSQSYERTYLLCPIYDDHLRPAKTLIWDIQKTSLNCCLLVLGDHIPHRKSPFPRAYTDKADLNPWLKHKHVHSDECLRGLASLAFKGGSPRSSQIAHSIDS